MSSSNNLEVELQDLMLDMVVGIGIDWLAVRV